MSVLQSTQDGVRTTTDGSILEVTLDRPKANAIDLAASRRLNAIFTAFRETAALRIAIITGAGEKFFSPGWDLKAAASGVGSAAVQLGKAAGATVIHSGGTPENE